VTFTIRAAIALLIQDAFGATTLALELMMVVLLVLTLALARTIWIVILVSQIEIRVAFGVKIMEVEFARRQVKPLVV